MRVLFVVFLIFSFLGSLSSQKPEPDTICSEADVFCNQKDFRGPWTLPGITMSTDYELCNKVSGSEGRAQNILFFAFVPTSNRVEFDIRINKLTPKPGDKEGYQYGIVDGCLEDKDSDVNYIVCDGSQVTDNVTEIRSSDFIPGHTYYLYVDGYTGCVVEFEIDLITGLGGYQVDEIESFIAINKTGDITDIAINDTVMLCSGGTFDFRSKNILNTDAYIWKYDDIISSQDTFFSTSLIANQDVKRVCHQGITGCDSSEVACFYIKVDTIPVVRIDTTICESDLSNGYTPPGGWTCGEISSGGTVYCALNDVVTGCKFKIEANVSVGQEPVVPKDSVVCDFTEVKKDSFAREMYLTQYGCDSMVDVNYYYFYFDGKIAPLECNDGVFELHIIYTTDLTVYEKYDVVWYLDGVEIPNSNSFVLEGVNSPGKYSATIQLSKKDASGKHLDCISDIEEYEVVSIPITSFALNVDTVCITDSCVLILDSYDESYDYNIQVLSSKGDIKALGNGRYEVRWDDFAGVDSIFVRLDGDCSVQTQKAIYVVPEVIKPAITCKEQTISSVEFEWETSDCVDEFDVWIDGIYKGTQSQNTYKVDGLAYGQIVKIQVETKNTDCVCGTKISIDSCTALDCPEVEVAIDNLPHEICYSDLDDVLTLNYSTDATGVASWLGDIVDNTGVILKENISSTEGGLFYVTLNFRVGDCDYKVEDSINIMPQVDAKIELRHISCYDMADGELFVEPLSGKGDFVLQLNEVAQDSMHVVNLEAGNYSIVLIDANGCEYSSSFEIVKPDIPNIFFEGDEIIELNSENTYSVDIEEYDSIAWFKNDTFLDVSSEYLDISSNKDFKLCYTVFFDTICQYSDCKQVRINRENEVFMPNIFSPNADNTNDYIFPISKNGLTYHINTYKIFDRWGEQVYEKSDFYIGGEVVPNIGWNGTFRNKQVPQGVYVYYIEILGDNGNITKLYGDCTLIR